MYHIPISQQASHPLGKQRCKPHVIQDAFFPSLPPFYFLPISMTEEEANKLLELTIPMKSIATFLFLLYLFFTAIFFTFQLINYLFTPNILCTL